MLKISIISGPDAGQSFELSEGVPHLIGRNNGTVGIDDAKISRRHAEITASRGKFVITDLGSSNGTFVNNRKIAKPTTLKSGGVFQVGQSVCEFRVLPKSEVEEDTMSRQHEPTISPPPQFESPVQTQQLLNEVRELLTQFVQSFNQGTAIIAVQTPDGSGEGDDTPSAQEPNVADEAPVLGGEAPSAMPTMADPAVLERLDEVLQNLRHLSDSRPHASHPTPPVESDTSLRIAELKETLQNDTTRHQFTQKLDALLEAVNTVPQQAEARSEALEKKLDDLLTIVAAHGVTPTLPAIVAAEGEVLAVRAQPASPDTIASLENKLDAILLTVQAQQDAMLEKQIDAVLASASAPAPSDADTLQQVVDQLRLRIDGLEQRVTQHMNQLSENSEAQWRKAITELTGALRTFTQRSDRALLEQLLTEVRGQNSQPVQEMLLEIRSKIRQSAPITHPTGGNASGNGELLSAVRDLQQQLQEQSQSVQRVLDYLDSGNTVPLERI